MDVAWIPAGLMILSVGAVLYLLSSKKRRPTQHDLDPTLKKNQIRITTQKKAFRREDLPPEYLASIKRREIVELPMGAARPEVVSSSSATLVSSPGNDWLPDNLKPVTKSTIKKQKKKA